MPCDGVVEDPREGEEVRLLLAKASEGQHFALPVYVVLMEARVAEAEQDTRGAAKIRGRGVRARCELATP